MLLVVLQEVYKQARYVALGISIALLVLLATIWLSSPGLIRVVLFSSTFNLAAKANILIASLHLFRTNFTLYSQITSLIIAFLAGMNVSLVVYYMKKRVAIEKAAGMSVFGITLGLLGVGCSACGSVILSSLFGIGATSAFIGFLPFNGAEFGVVSIIVLVFSVVFITKKINDPEVCAIDSDANV